LTKPRLWIITPLSRPDNLVKIAPHLVEAGQEFDCTWVIVHDCRSGFCDDIVKPDISEVGCQIIHHPSNPGETAGHAQVNAALDRVVSDGWCWRLDDDNLPVPGFFACLRNEIDNRPDRVFAFEQYRDGFKTAPERSAQYVVKPNFAPRGIDSAQFVWHSSVDSTLRFDPTKYEADGIFASALWDRVRGNVAFISGPLTDYNALQRKASHFYQTIDGFFHFEPLYRRVVAEAQDGAIFVEVGVWKGRSAAFMGTEIVNSGKRITLYAVDAFTTTHDGAGSRDETRLAEVRRTLNPLTCVTVVPSLSVDAAANFPNGSLDFVFIDADHSYEGVRRDIEAWLPKVKPGGLLAGDDYCYPGCEGVKRAVDSLLPGAITPTEFVEGVSGWWEYRVPETPRVETVGLVSVFTPMSAVGRPYFDEAYRSLCAQTHKNWEWVVLTNHGGSIPLGHPAIYDRRVRLIHNDALNGIGALKREACARARGDVLVELDHDDILTPDALHEIRRAFDDGADFVYSDFAEFHDNTWAPRIYPPVYGWKSYRFEYEGHKLLAQVAPQATPQTLRTVLYSPNHVRAWRTSAYWRVGGHDASMPVMDDHDLVVRCYLDGMRFQHIAKCLYLYRLHNNSVVLSRNAEVQTARVRSYEKFCWQLAEMCGRVWTGRDTSCKNEMKPGEWLFLICDKRAWYDRTKIPLLAGDFHIAQLYEREYSVECQLIKLGDGYSPMGEMCE
jgi:hypothetical protein